MNRGRIQAQGNRTEKSAPWATQKIHTKDMGIERVENLSNQLTPAELNLRRYALQSARKRIFTSPSFGISAVNKKSYYDDLENRHIRIDVEVLAGIAFMDDPNRGGGNIG
jgi:hypothetical protein